MIADWRLFSTGNRNIINTNGTREIFLLVGDAHPTRLVFYKALKTGEISRIIPITSCYPLFTFLLGWMFLGEDVTLSKVIGMLLILGGIFLLK